MRHVSPLFAAILAVTLVAGPAVSSAFALRVKDARIAHGAVEIRGRNAQGNATMTIDGEPAGTSGPRGRFKLSTTSLPPNCVAEVADGVETVEAVIKFCGPVGRQGPLSPREALLASHACPGCDLAGAGLPAAVLNSAILNDANLSGAVLVNANLSGANLDRTNLEGADLSGANLTKASLRDASFVDAWLVSADITGANLDAAILHGTDLRGANLTDANADNASVLGIVYDSNTICPTGSPVGDGGADSGTPYGFKIACGITLATTTVRVSFCCTTAPDCHICGSQAECFKQNTRTLADPTPPGSLVIEATVAVAASDCANTTTVKINDLTIGSASFDASYSCSCGDCDPVGPMTVTDYDGLPGWEYGSDNQLTIISTDIDNDPTNGGNAGCYAYVDVDVTYIHR